MSFKRFFTGALLLLSVVASTSSFAQKQQVMIDKVVAIVGGSSILYSEVREYATMLVEQRRAEGYTSDRDPMNEALENLMRQKLLYNQSLIDSVQVGGDVATYAEQRLQAMIQEEGSIAKFEEKQHMPIYNFREILRQRLTEQEGARAMQNHVIEDVVVTPGEVENYYKSLAEEDIPLVPEQYVYSHIVRYPDSQEEAKQRTKERLLEMRERIISGKSTLPILARTYSVDPGSAMRGGEYPPGPLEQLTPPFADALAKLKPGQISEVVETDYGFHIIELIDEPKNNLYHYRHILLKPTYTHDELLAPNRFLDSLSQVIRADSISFEEAAKKHSQDDMTKMNGGLVTNHDILMSNPSYANVKYSNTKFTRESFGDGKSLQDYAAISSLKEGEVSGAFMTADLKGNELSKIIKLVKVIPTHTATLEEDYLTIEEMALNEKKEKAFREWLSEKIDGIYVFIDPEFRDGEFEFPNWVK
ncbi:MAG: peptidylprolyl isomerase [Rikenellaceae bacterium]|nr:peptidylprolyl isomerase [Rikenellaceae bacterium]